MTLHDGNRQQTTVGWLWRREQQTEMLGKIEDERDRETDDGKEKGS
jgi:hypothetical protein